ncbi:unnamed protein product [Diatraea saccharalis]|uniref:Centrosome-associated zinc finger protein CP190 n=1 Tax=Diatraea saccharalis TaxID=40085 RepID=A0A9N9R736_9NEOP|nr:unnamed protein product [Diatraea saccharalis]
MSDVKQVKVDNWGIYFLQRLKHFFNRTDYCDLTLQFQDNAQLKVHRLVLNACTEYFELLERTCEMYEDCLVMPDDLQADVVVPIINFMYTGQLEFKMDSLEKLYQTSLVMNMPVLTKLLEAHRTMHVKTSSSQRYSGMKINSKSNDLLKTSKYSNHSSLGKRSFNKAFDNYKTYPQKSADTNKAIMSNKTSEVMKSKSQNNNKIIYREKKFSVPKNTSPNNNGIRAPSPIPLDNDLYTKKFVLGGARPTRYELPEELDTDNIFENSFSKLSYTSTPLMVHPETSKHYSKRSNIFTEASGLRKGKKTTVDIVECKKNSRSDNLFEDDCIQACPDDDMFQSAYLSVKDEDKDPNQLFDQMLDSSGGPKVTIESKDKQAGNLDHAKIISEVLKKYPHLVKSNKNIKLKIVNSSTKTKKPPQPEEKAEIKPKPEVAFSYETDVLDSKEAAKLIAMGAENIKGPWICLICGTPGRALNFTSYYNFRRHLVEVHNEKPVSTICEYCGLRSYKRNYLLHHIYTKHGVPPPPQYNFPKCNLCDYVALTEAFLIKHKLTHTDSRTFRCHVCTASFNSTNQLLHHMHKTGHLAKEKNMNFQCEYCMKVFLRESNFYVHLKTSHRDVAIRDGIIEDSDDERQIEVKPKVTHDMKADIKYEHSFDNEYEDNSVQYQAQPKTDVKTSTKKALMPTQNAKHKILNPGFSTHSTKPAIKQKVTPIIHNEYTQEIDNPSPQANDENIVLIDGDEYVMKENQLIPKKTLENTEYVLSNMPFVAESDPKLTNLEASITPTTTIEFANLDNTDTNIQQSKMIMKKSANINQPIQIVVSNEEEYKALMSSNHSIIFDDGDTNKTLTVLTAPHANSINNTAIELQNSQPGDMMIIQQDYPLNVSETVSAVSADSNFVVVYSHAVGHESPPKQYQIITPPEIGAQFVQASEVMTQNFETVTTSTSILNNHVIEAQIEESWPQQTNATTTIQETALKTDNKVSEIECKEIDETMEQTVTVPNTSLTELPEIQLSSTTESSEVDAVTLETLSHNIIEGNSINLEAQHTAKQVIIEEIQNNSTEVMDIDIATEVIADKQVVTEVVDQIETEELPQSSDVSQDEHCTVHDTSNVFVESQNTQEIVEQTKESDENIKHNTTNNTEEVQMEELHDTVQPTNTESISAPKVVEQIQNITSEWSEDEYDLVTEAPVKEIKNPEAEIEAQVTEESEVEESIENIQQEMQKQLSHIDEMPVSEENIDSNEKHLDSINPESPKQNEETNTNMDTNQVKITSLLNDWEDNDSQEENVSTNKNDNVVQTSVIENEVQTTINQNETNDDVMVNKKSEENESKPDDNIKSLVSDWDDEDEETKE